MIGVAIGRRIYSLTEWHLAWRVVVEVKVGVNASNAKARYSRLSDLTGASKKFDMGLKKFSFVALEPSKTISRFLRATAHEMISAPFPC